MTYISNGEWFDKGAVVQLIDDYRPLLNSGLFEGMRTCKNPLSESRQLEERYLDEEVCSFDEFEVLDV